MWRYIFALYERDVSGFYVFRGRIAGAGKLSHSGRLMARTFSP